MAQWVQNQPAMQETRVKSLGWEDPLEEGMATHSSILAWRTPWTEETAGYSPRGCKESDTTEATECVPSVALAPYSGLHRVRSLLMLTFP